MAVFAAETMPGPAVGAVVKEPPAVPVSAEQPFLGSWYTRWHHAPMIFHVSVGMGEEGISVSISSIYPPGLAFPLSVTEPRVRDGVLEFYHQTSERMEAGAPLRNRLFLHRLVPSGDALLLEASEVRLVRQLAPLVAAYDEAAENPAPPPQQAKSGSTEEKYAPKHGLGELAPALRASSWLRGEPVTLAAERGKRAVLVVFWHSSLLQYDGSLARLEIVARRHRAGAVVAVLSPEEPDYLDHLLEDELDIRLAIDAHAACQRELLGALGMEGMPTAVLVDREGRFAWAGHPADPELDAALERCAPTIDP
jgi:hypothetical protein